MEATLKTRVVVRSLNKIAAQAKVAAAREIKEAGYNLKAGVIKKDISVIKAKPGSLVAVVRARGRPIGLIHWSARQNRRGVSVRVLGKRKLIKGAFIATMPTGHTGVFRNLRSEKHKKLSYMRVEFVNGRPRSKGLQRSQGKIKELFGPSIPKAFANEVVQRELHKLIKAKFPEILRHEARHALRRR